MRPVLRARLRGLSAAAVQAALAELLGGEVELELRQAMVRPQALGAASDVGLLLGEVGAPVERAVLLEIDGALVAAVAAKVLQGQAPALYDTTLSPSPRLIGVAAAVCTAALRRASPAPMQVFAAGPAQALAADLARQGTVCCGLASLRLAGAHYSARLSALAPQLEGELEREATRWREVHTPLSLPFVLARLVVPRSLLASLTLGDALTLPELEGEDGERRGWLVAPASELGVRATLKGEQLRYEAIVEPLPWTGELLVGEEQGEPEMSEDGEHLGDEDFKEGLGEIPVVVRVEVGSTQLSVKRWGELTAGDLLPLHQRLGAPVTLRVSGVEVAQGELVQIDGEVGVRIIRRLDLPPQ